MSWLERQAVLTLWRLHGLCAERSNVPRDSAALYEAVPIGADFGDDHPGISAITTHLS